MTEIHEPTNIISGINEMCSAAHQNSKNKGFWDCKTCNGKPLDNGFCMDCTGTGLQDPNVGEKLMLMVTELAEAFEAYRKGQADKPCDKPCLILDPICKDVHEIDCPRCCGAGSEPNHKSEDVQCPSCVGTKKIKVTGVRRLTNMEEEMADIVIRVGDWCGYKGIDLGRAVISKMVYNMSRPHMHNKTC